MTQPLADTDRYDLIVIGGGPAGYVAAIRGAQLGFRTACIEKRKTLGGTCLNVGCIPSKALLDSSEHFLFAKQKAAKHGIVLGEVKLDLAAMLKRKETVVRQLTQGIAGLFKKNKVEHVLGHGKLVGREPATGMDLKFVEVTSESGVRRLAAPRILLATGSEPASLPFLPFDAKNVVSSTEALEFTEVPKHLVVIGGGVIGLEMGSVWSRLGSKVTVVEFLDRPLAGTDKGAALELQKILTKQGIEFKLNSKCLGAKPNPAGGMTVEVEDRATAHRFTVDCDKVLVSTGRRPYSDGLGLESLGIPTDKQGRVQVDSHLQTSVPGVYAVGDLIVGPMLAHKAEEEGIAAVETMAGQAGHVNYEAIPSVVYTWPELASVGATEEELKEKNIPYKAGSFPFLANGRAKAMEETEGTVKILAHAQTDRVLGVHIVGAAAGTMIAEAVAVIEYGGSAEDIARTSHAHPTLAEVVKEAALAVDKRQIHL
jgi:dihydrolipoamide dehydrogenase